MPARYSARGATKRRSPLRKNVRSPGKKSPGKRFSARAAYDGGMALGTRKKILQPDGRYKTKVLAQRSNGSPYWKLP